MKKITSPKGSAPLIAVIVIIAVIALAGIGAGLYLLNKKKTAQAPAPGGESAASGAVNDITVTAPDLEFSFSALPSLEVSSLNIQTPQFPGQGIFKSFSVDSDFTPTVDTSLSTPSPTFTPPPPPTPTTPTAPTTPTPPPGGGAPTTDCAQFSAVPACSYVGAPGSQGYEACKTCFPNK